MNVYEIKVESTGEFIREFAGDYLLDLCLSTWTRIKGLKVIAALKKEKESLGDQHIELESLYGWLRYWAQLHNDMKTLGIVTGCHDTKNLAKLQKIYKCIALGEELFALQANENQDRGVAIVREIALDLYRQDMEGAKQLAFSDWDKIRSYPQIVQWLQKEGIAEKDW